MQNARFPGAEFSFELFPPKTEAGSQSLRTTRARLAALSPRFFSVTYGAGGTTQARSFDTIGDILAEGRVSVVPHLTCIGSSEDGIRSILDRFRDQGIRRLVALRGDFPPGTDSGTGGHFGHAAELVATIRKAHGDWFDIDVGCYPEVHPQAASATADLMHFKAKVDAGASGAITQYFYSIDAYDRFVDRCRSHGIDIPIVPGIMPILNYHQLARFSDGCGAEIPRWLRQRLQELADDPPSLQAFGIEVVADLCRRLLDGGAPGLHIYTLNQARATEQLWTALELTPSEDSAEIAPERL